MNNKEIKDLYADASYPVAAVDANCYITWANKAAKELYPDLFRRDGLRKLARFSDERILISRYVKNNIGATLRPRQIGYTNLQLTLTPLPQSGREMLLTLAVDRKLSPVDTGFGAGEIACSMPKIKETVKQLCDELSALAVQNDGHALAAIKHAGEIINVAEHLSLFSHLSMGARPRLTACATKDYFSELLMAVREVLTGYDISFRVDCADAVIDHALVARALLMLIANAAEFGDGSIGINVYTADDDLIFKVRNGVRTSSQTDAKRAIDPYFSVYEDNEEDNNRIGIGLTTAGMIAAAHGGTLFTDSADGFEVTMIVRSGKNRNVPGETLKSKTEYIADRFSPVMTELAGFAK